MSYHSSYSTRLRRSSCLTRLVTILLVSASVRAASSNPFPGTHLFPIPILEGWTTAPPGVDLSGVKSSKPIIQLPLSDKSLNIDDPGWMLAKASSAPDGTPAYHAWYPKNSYSRSKNPGSGGYGYSFKGGVDISHTDHMLFSYAVYFEEGFDFVWGGKLPGPYGGTTDAIARSCAGGQQEHRDLCWSTRIMWRKEGAGEIYIYMPSNPENQGLMNLNGSEPDPGIYGFSIARGAFSFTRGGWTVVTQRVQLNKYGVADGELELWANGVSVIHATGLVLRANPATQVSGILAQTFFGGGNESWASSKDQSSWVTAYSTAILAPGASPAQGHAAYPLRRANNGFNSAAHLSSTALLLAGIVGLGIGWMW